MTLAPTVSPCSRAPSRRALKAEVEGMLARGFKSRSTAMARKAVRTEPAGASP